MAENPFEGFAENLAAAPGPLKRLSAVTAQLELAAIPADAACCCLCSIYDPHLCEGWRTKGLMRRVPAGKLFGKQLPDVEVPLCQACHGVPVRKN